MRLHLPGLGCIFRRPWLLLAGVALLGGGAVVAAPHIGAWRHRSAGRSALERYHAEEARKHLDACLAVWPNNAEALLLASRAARRAGDLEEAERRLRACQRLQANPSDAVVLEWALLRATTGRTEDVEEYLRSRARKEPATAPLVWEALAEGYLRMYRIMDSLACLDSLLELQPDNTQALFLRGNVWRQVGSASKAADEYTRVVELDPERDDARRQLGRSLLGRARAAEALAHFEHLRRKGADDPGLLVDVARCLDDLSRRDEARDLLDTVLANHPEHALALRERGRLALLSGKVHEAEGLLRRAVAAAPRDFRTRYHLQEALRRLGKTAEAEAEAKQAKYIESCLERLGMMTQRRMSANPYDASLHCEMGTLLIALGHEELGRRWLLSALQRDPNYQPARTALDKLKKKGTSDTRLR